MIDFILIFLIICLTLFILIKSWKLLSKFYHKNYSIFNFLFLLSYFIEQLLFLLFYNLYPNYREFWIGLIILFITTTTSIEKFLADSRQKMSSNNIKEALNTIEKQKKSIKEQKDEITSLKEENKLMQKFIKEKILQ